MVRTPVEVNAGAAVAVADEPVDVDVEVWANVLQANRLSFQWTPVWQGTVQSGREFCLPGGYLSQEFQVKLTTTGPLQGFMLAEAIEDLP